MAAEGEIRVVVDAEHGGRWTSLRAPNGREWLWRRDAPERSQVRPGDAFVDAGGLEECIPTVGGAPDHGDAWSRRWVADGDGLLVRGDGYELRRTTATRGGLLTAAYRLQAVPGWRFIWSGHALLDVSTEARLVAPTGHPVVVGDPSGERTCRWPWLGATDLGLLGPPDGTAMMVRLLDLHELTVLDRGDRLTLSLSAPGLPRTMAIWRNLGGWPEAAPYRSVGIEPLLGRTADRAIGAPGDVVTVPGSGSVSWTLSISAGLAGDRDQGLLVI